MTESPKDVLHKVERGKAPETPFVLWTAMHVVIGAVVLVIAGIALILYYTLK